MLVCKLQFILINLILNILIKNSFYKDLDALQHSLGNLDVNTGVIVNDFDPNKWNVRNNIK